MNRDAEWPWRYTAGGEVSEASGGVYDPVQPSMGRMVGKGSSSYEVGLKETCKTGALSIIEWMVSWSYTAERVQLKVTKFGVLERVESHLSV